MNRSALRAVITILALVTAIIHGVVLNINMGGLDPAFTLNAIGYVTLLAALFYVPVPFLKGRETLLHYVFMAFAAVTIVAYFLVNAHPFSDLVGLTAKTDEVLLIVALWLHLRAPAA